MSRLILLLAFLFFCAPCFGQEDSLPVRYDSILRSNNSTDTVLQNMPVMLPANETRITAKEFLYLQAGSLKQVFTKPFHMTGRNWGDVGKFALVIGAFSFADRPVQQFALDVRNSNKGLPAISNQVTRFGGPYTVYALGALGAYSFLLKKGRMQTTTLLAVQSYITSGILERTVKLIAGRQRPFIISSPEGRPEPLFHGPAYMLRETREDRFGSSFPSGHTTAAFAAATVFAQEYRDKPWIPVVAYTAASLVGVSRLSENKHWVTDVLAGAALGYVSGKLVVKNYRRHIGQQVAKKEKTKASLTMSFNQGILMPGFVYRF